MSSFRTRPVFFSQTSRPAHILSRLRLSEAISLTANKACPSHLRSASWTPTCKPVSGIWLDLWHTNATGVYSGLQAGGNGKSGDTSNLKNTAFRGIQTTDSDGVVQFETMFPGHYTSKRDLRDAALITADIFDRSCQSYPRPDAQPYLRLALRD